MAANSRFAVATHIITAIEYLSKHLPKGYENDEGRVSSELLAGSVNTNRVVVRRLVADLTKAGILRSYKGKGGGLELGRPADCIRLLDIYEALGEEPVFAFNPNRPNGRCPVSRSMDKILEPVFETTQTMVKEGLAKLKVSDLVKHIK